MICYLSTELFRWNSISFTQIQYSTFICQSGLRARRDEKGEKSRLRNVLDSFQLLPIRREQVSFHFILPTCYLFPAAEQNIVDVLQIISKDKSLKTPEDGAKKDKFILKLSKQEVYILFFVQEDDATDLVTLSQPVPLCHAFLRLLEGVSDVVCG